MAQPFKRQYREPSVETRNKISATLRGKNIQRSEQTKQKISDGLKKYWSQIPSANQRNDTDITDLI